MYACFQRAQQFDKAAIGIANSVDSDQNAPYRSDLDVHFLSSPVSFQKIGIMLVRVSLLYCRS